LTGRKYKSKENKEPEMGKKEKKKFQEDKEAQERLDCGGKVTNQGLIQAPKGNKKNRLLEENEVEKGKTIKKALSNTTPPPGGTRLK